MTKTMTGAEWKAARTSCKQTNRELVEHTLTQLYEHMGWKPFHYIIWDQAPAGAPVQPWGFPPSQRWDYRTQRWVPRHEQVSLDRLKHHSNSAYVRNLLLLANTNDLSDLIGAKFSNYEEKLRGACANDPWYHVLREPQTHLMGWSRKGRKNTEITRCLDILYAETVVINFNRDTPHVLEKPYEAHWNAAGQLHCETGPAVHWRDGRRQYWWNGVEVSHTFIEKEPTLRYIHNERNAERRRILIERYGPGRYLKDIKAKCIAEDKYGKLWWKEGRTISTWNISAKEEDVVFVEVINSTPEPDGHYKTYFLRVPPHTRTPKEGIAWTFEVPEMIYSPLEET